MILNSPFVPFLDDDDLDVATGTRLTHEYRPLQDFDSITTGVYAGV